jgi:hypothetical protein
VFSIIKKIEDKKKRAITNLKNIKNEIRYYNKLQEANYTLEKSQQKRLVTLFNLKKDYVKEILVLKSSFSIVDQMFLQEIENAEIIKRSWFRDFFCWKGSIELKEPEKLNKFISGIMDPFKDKEDDDIIRKKEEEYQEKEREIKRYQDEKMKKKKDRDDKAVLEREQRRQEMRNKNIVCWPFCYSVLDESKIEKNKYDDWKKLEKSSEREKINISVLEEENTSLKIELDRIQLYLRRLEVEQQQQHEHHQRFSSSRPPQSSPSKAFQHFSIREEEKEKEKEEEEIQEGEKINGIDL